MKIISVCNSGIQFVEWELEKVFPVCVIKRIPDDIDRVRSPSLKALKIFTPGANCAPALGYVAVRFAVIPHINIGFIAYAPRNKKMFPVGD